MSENNEKLSNAVDIGNKQIVLLVEIRDMMKGVLGENKNKVRVIQL